MKRLIFLPLCLVLFHLPAYASPGILQVYCRVIDRENGAILDPQVYGARFFPDMDAVPPPVQKYTSDFLRTVIDLRISGTALKKVMREVENIPKAFKNCNSRFVLLRADVALETPVEVEMIADEPYFFGKPKQISLLFKRILSEDAVDRRTDPRWAGGHPYVENVHVKSRNNSRITLHESPNGPVLGYVEHEFTGERLRTDGNWVLVKCHLGRVYIDSRKNQVTLVN